MGGGTSKKYEGMTCHSCSLPATVKSFLDGSYVPMCEEHDEITKAKAKAKESRFHPTSFIDNIPIPTDNTDNIPEAAVTNFLRGDVIVLIGPRKERSVVMKQQPVQRHILPGVPRQRDLVPLHACASPPRNPASA